MSDSILSAVTAPSRLWSRDEVRSSPCPVPAVAGIYGWYFKELPCDTDVSGCVTSNGLTLLYVGISPSAPSASSASVSRGTLRSRIRSHYFGNASASTLRLTLGALLGEQLGMCAQLSKSGRLIFGDGEGILSGWMGENAFVAFAPHPQPWIAEGDLLHRLDLPLNLRGNGQHPFWPILSSARAAVRATARSAQ